MRVKPSRPVKKIKPSLKSAWGQVLELIRKNQVFLLTTHVNPDGDGLGAQSALFCALRSLGKKVLVVNEDRLPPRLSYLPFASVYQTSPAIPPHEACFVMDAGDFSRIRTQARREDFRNLVNIDHHYSNNHYGDVNLVDPGACATGEIVYHLIRALGVPLDHGDRRKPLYRPGHRYGRVSLFQHHLPGFAFGRGTHGCGGGCGQNIREDLLLCEPPSPGIGSPFPRQRGHP